MVWYFIGVYIINRTFHGRLEIRHFSSRVEKKHTRRETQISRYMAIYGQALGVLNAKTINVFATEKRQSCIKSKL